MASKKHTVISRPLARTDRLLVEAVGDEAVIFDLETRSSHALKPLAAAVFNYADGSNTVAEIAELVSYRLATQVTEADVVDVVAQLAELELLDAPELDVESGGLSRRDALKTIAAVGAGAALISTVTASTALASAAGQAKLGDDQACEHSHGGVMIPTAGPYAGYVFPLPQTTSWTAPGGGVITGLGGGPATFTAQDGVNNTVYGDACEYLVYNGQGNSNCNNYRTEPGKWECVPCDGPTLACCQVVCAPAGYGYDWGIGAPAPAGAGYLPYIGCGTSTVGSCPSPGSPDYTAQPYGYYGKYCTRGGGQS
jgi:hypothetical protein